MKQTIWKFPFKEFTNGICGMEMPEGAKILEVGKQRGVWCIWALVDPTACIEIRNFSVHGTGWEFYAEGETHLRTFLDGDYVWHLFEVVSRVS